MTVIANTENTQDNSSTHPEPRPGSWEAAFLAGLPHILMGLLIGTSKFLICPLAFIIPLPFPISLNS